jgi:hypothetical protein
MLSRFQESFLGIVEGTPGVGGADPSCLEKKMETLIFALIASYNAHRLKESVVAEPEEFQPFDLEALRNSGENKLSRSPSRREAHVPQTA